MRDPHAPVGAPSSGSSSLRLPGVIESGPSSTSAIVDAGSASTQIPSGDTPTDRRQSARAPEAPVAGPGEDTEVDPLGALGRPKHVTLPLRGPVPPPPPPRSQPQRISAPPPPPARPPRGAAGVEEDFQSDVLRSLRQVAESLEVESQRSRRTPTEESRPPAPPAQLRLVRPPPPPTDLPAQEPPREEGEWSRPPPPPPARPVLSLAPLPLSDRPATPLPDRPATPLPLSDQPLAQLPLSDEPLAQLPLSDEPLAPLPARRGPVPLPDVPVSTSALPQVRLSRPAELLAPSGEQLARPRLNVPWRWLLIGYTAGIGTVLLVLALLTLVIGGRQTRKEASAPVPPPRPAPVARPAPPAPPAAPAQAALPPTTAQAAPPVAVAPKAPPAAPAVVAAPPPVAEEPALPPKQIARLRKRLERCALGGGDDEILRQVGDAVETRIDLGTCAVKKGRIEEGIRHYEVALQRRPGEPWAVLGMARAYEKDGQLDRALGWYRRYAAAADEGVAKKLRRHVRHLEKKAAQPDGG